MDKESLKEEVGNFMKLMEPIIGQPASIHMKIQNINYDSDYTEAWSRFCNENGCNYKMPGRTIVLVKDMIKLRDNPEESKLTPSSLMKLKFQMSYLVDTANAVSKYNPLKDYN